MNGRNPPPLLDGGLVRDTLLRFNHSRAHTRSWRRAETPDERLLPLGGVNGRNPPPLLAGGCAHAALRRHVARDPCSSNSDSTNPSASSPPTFGRLLLAGGLRGRNPPRFRFEPRTAGFTVVRFDWSIHLSIRGRTCARPLHIRTRNRGVDTRRRTALNASASWDCAHMVLLHRLPQTRGLLLERNRPRDVVMRPSKEPLRATVTNRGRRCCTPAGRKLPRDGTTGSCPPSCVLRRFAARVAGIGLIRPVPKCACIHCRQCPANMVVMNVRDIGETLPAMQRYGSLRSD